MTAGLNVSFKLNGKNVSGLVEPHKTLLEFLRENFGLTSIKKGCQEGECGACTVIIDGLTANACLMLAPQVEGAEVITTEFLSVGSVLHPIQAAFIDKGAVQCGYCTPGMLLSVKALLDKEPKPDESEIKTAISGNFCRCTGYKKIIEAVQVVTNQVDRSCNNDS